MCVAVGLHRSPSRGLQARTGWDTCPALLARSLRSSTSDYQILNIQLFGHFLSSFRMAKSRDFDFYWKTKYFDVKWMFLVRNLNVHSKSRPFGSRTNSDYLKTGRVYMITVCEFLLPVKFLCWLVIPHRSGKVHPSLPAHNWPPRLRSKEFRKFACSAKKPRH